MGDHCKMEFYFKVKDIQDLLAKNPSATGIIVTQQIKTRINATTKMCTNSLEISARVADVSSSDGQPRTMEASSKRAAIAAADKVGGCPYPPGCS